MNNSEQLQVEKIQNGDKKAFEVLFKEYYFRLTRFAWRYVNSRATAEDLVQGIFAEIWESREQFIIVSSLRSYLYKAVKNKCLNYLKHEKVERKYDELWMDEKENPTIYYEDRLREKQIRKAIKQAIEDLPSRSKMTYKLHRYDGLTYQEIAEVMNISIKTVESQMSRTLKILRERLSHLLPFLLIAAMKSMGS